MPLLLTLFALVGCRGDTATCSGTALTDSWPAEGAAPISTSASIRLDLDGTIATDDATVTVTASGSSIAGSLSLTDTGLSWTPDAALPAETTVSWSLDACGSTAAGSFTTGRQGEQLSAADLSDTTFSLDLDNATWISPEGGAALFSQLFGGALLLGVQDLSNGQIDLIGGAAELLDSGSLQQDPCIPTFDFEAVSFENNPYVAVGPTTVQLDFQGVPIPVTDLSLSGAFTDGGQALTDGRLAAQIDARDIASSVGMTADQLCELVLQYSGLACMDCASDGETTCINLEIEDIQGTLQPTLRVAPNPDPQECTSDTGGGA